MLKALGLAIMDAQGRAVRAQLPDRRDPQGRLDRHRRRRRHAFLLLVQGPPRTAGCACSARRRNRAAVEGTAASSGQHIYTPLQGVAVHINAFNFPVWGMLEKLAPTLLGGRAGDRQAGVGDRYLAEAAFRVMIESRRASGWRDPADCRRSWRPVRPSHGQDVVSFTGSASTALKLRTHPVVLRECVKFVAEQDSLNASMLGPDAAPGTPEFDLFVREDRDRDDGQGGPEMHRHPPRHAPGGISRCGGGGVAETPGDTQGRRPPRPKTHAWARWSASPSATTSAQKIAELEAAGARIVAGDPTAEPPIAGGAFLDPVLLRTDDPWTSAAPCTTSKPSVRCRPSCPIAIWTMPSRSPIAAWAALRCRCSPIRRDAARDFVLGAAAFHGRMLVIDRDNHKESTGHGSPLPVLVHGGPGRAGGGEEMGGIRGVKHYMQRTAIQSSPAMIAAITGQYIPGAPKPRSSTRTHSARR